MRKSLFLAMVAGVVALVWAAPAWSHSSDPPVVLVDDSTPAHYNAALGTSLDSTQAQFPCANILCGDPTINQAAEPDLSAASAALGGWLSNPQALNANWSSPQTIPPSWDLNSETAIVYQVDAGRCGARDVMGSFGVDNGIFVWVDGVYAFGALAPGGAIAGEYVIPLGNMSRGANFVQVLREDHGGMNGYTVQITGKLAGCGGDNEDEDDEDNDHEHGEHHHGHDEHGDDEDNDHEHGEHHHQGEHEHGDDD